MKAVAIQRSAKLFFCGVWALLKSCICRDDFHTPSPSRMWNMLSSSTVEWVTFSVLANWITGFRTRSCSNKANSTKIDFYGEVPSDSIRFYFNNHGSCRHQVRLTRDWCFDHVQEDVLFETKKRKLISVVSAA